MQFPFPIAPEQVNFRTGGGWGQGVLSQETDGQPPSWGKWQLPRFLPSLAASTYRGVRKRLCEVGRLSSPPQALALSGGQALSGTGTWLSLAGWSQAERQPEGH